MGSHAGAALGALGGTLALPGGGTIGGGAAGAVGGGALGAAGGSLLGAWLGDMVTGRSDDDCDDDDFCYKREDAEIARCSQWSAFKDWGAVTGCIQRAKIRRDMCVRNGGTPHPDEPPEWSADDIF